LTTPPKVLQIASLPFDSSLFGYPVGKYVADETWKEHDFLTQAEAFRLVYLFSKNPLNPNSDRIRDADIKLTFSKDLTKSAARDPGILPYSGLLSDQLFTLALESGIFSRFRTDSNFKDSEFEKLYKIWVQNALDRKEVLIADDFSGFVSCAGSGETAQIGLIAVDKNERGKGWAKRLMQAAERKAFLQGAKCLIVSTQEMNIPASKLYESLGFELNERIFVYHYRNG